MKSFGQGSTRNIFHSHEVGVIATTPVVHAHDVGVIEIGGRLGFATESFNECRVGCILGEEHFDRHKAIKQDVAGQIHVGHATATDALLHFVTIVQYHCVVVRHNSSQATEVGDLETVAPAQSRFSPCLLSECDVENFLGNWPGQGSAGSFTDFGSGPLEHDDNGVFGGLGWSKGGDPGV